MKTFSFLLLLVLFHCHHSQAQVDTSFSIVRKNIPAKFTFSKFSKSYPVQNYPVYTIDKSQIHRMNMLLRSFVNNEAGCDLLLKNYDQMDSIYNIKELHYTEIIKMEELRSKNYEEAYKSLLTINTQLDQQLKNCRALAVSEHKKNKSHYTVLGILAGLSAGIVIGVFAD